MKLKILLFLFISIFLITSAALAMPGVLELATVSEPFIMLLFGTCLIGVASVGKTLLKEKALNKKSIM
jgi:hypothetical protein